jgi:hypothetical protein
MSDQKEEVRDIGSIAREDIEGLSKLADESEAGKMRRHLIRRKVNRLYRRYV